MGCSWSGGSVFWAFYVWRLTLAVWLMVLAGGAVGAVAYPVCGGTVFSVPYVPFWYALGCDEAFSFVAVEDLNASDGVGYCEGGTGSTRIGWVQFRAACFSGPVQATTYGESPTGVYWACTPSMWSSVAVEGGYEAHCQWEPGTVVSFRGVFRERPDLYDLEAGWAMSALGLTSNELLSILVIAVLVIIYIVGFGIGKQP